MTVMEGPSKSFKLVTISSSGSGLVFPLENQTKREKIQLNAKCKTKLNIVPTSPLLPPYFILKVDQPGPGAGNMENNSQMQPGGPFCYLKKDII